MTEPTADILRHQFAAELARAADITGDARFKIAAGLLLGRRPGRRRYDRDDAAVHEIAALVEAGDEPTPTAAARRVAKSLREGIPVENTASRLMGKYRATYRKK